MKISHIMILVKEICCKIEYFKPGGFSWIKKISVEKLRSNIIMKINILK